METKTKPLIMSSIKEKAATLPQIDLDGDKQPEIVINVKFAGVEVKQILVNLDKLEFNALDPGNAPTIELTLTDVV